MASTVITRPIRQIPTAAHPILQATKEINGQKNAIQPAETVQRQCLAQEPQAVKQQQSLALVQIMLHASFSTLFYLREFLPLSCFGECDLHTLSSHHPNPTYTDFINGDSVQSTNLERRGQPLKVILRGREAKADHILDLLEHGVFDALNKNVLEAVQLTVFVNKEAPSQVLESYTFSFAYTGDTTDLNTRLASVSLKSAGTTTEVKTFRTAKAGLDMIIRRLITLSTVLPILPDRRYLGIHLIYTDDCPSAYEPPGFNATTHGHLLFPRNRNWSKETQSCGVMDSGFHTVGLTVTSLKWAGGEQEGQDNDRRIPDALEYQDVVDREDDIGTGILDEELVTGDKAHENSLGSTQDCHDAIGEKMLQQMQLDSSILESDFVPTQVKSHSGIEPKAPKPELSQLRVKQLREKKLQIEAEGTTVSGMGDEAVLCQCGWDGQDSDIIQCEFCHKWQHLICYGFSRVGDENIPEIHTCYRCLLEPGETNILREMDTLALLRRALDVIMQDGYSNLREFSKKLHCNGHTAVQVTDLLKKQGYLQDTPGSKKKGFAKTGLSRFMVPDSERVRQRLREEIFNPWVKLAHHYVIPAASQVHDKDSSIQENLNHEQCISRQEPTQQEREIASTLEPVYRDGQSKVTQVDNSSRSNSTQLSAGTSPPSSSCSNSKHARLKTRPSPTASTARFLRSSSARSGVNHTVIDNYLPRKRRKASNAYPVDVRDPMD